jgi:hypothetical protein
MDFQRMGIDADAMAKFVQDRTDLHVNIFKIIIYNFIQF